MLAVVAFAMIIELEQQLERFKSIFLDIIIEYTLYRFENRFPMLLATPKKHGWFERKLSAPNYKASFRAIIEILRLWPNFCTHSSRANISNNFC